MLDFCSICIFPFDTSVGIFRPFLCIEKMPRLLASFGNAKCSSTVRKSSNSCDNFRFDKKDKKNYLNNRFNFAFENIKLEN